MGLTHQPLRQFRIDAPVAAFVGLGQSGTPHRRSKAHGKKLVRLRVQAGFDVAQTLAISQLGKGHGTKLLGASEGANSAVAAVTSHTAGKRGPGKKIHQLRKQQLASVQSRLQKRSLDTASRQFQIDTTQKRAQLLADQKVAEGKLAVNRTVSSATHSLPTERLFSARPRCRQSSSTVFRNPNSLAIRYLPSNPTINHPNAWEYPYVNELFGLKSLSWFMCARCLHTILFSLQIL